jgi:hypothetical protein
MFKYTDIQQRLRRQPFVPVRFVTSAGETFDVPHPDLVWVGVRDIHIGTPHKNDPRTYDHVTRLAIMHITSMVDLPVAAKAGSNGE